MASNLGDRVAWGSSKSEGPIIAITELERVTNTWNYIAKIPYIYKDDGGGNII